MGEMLLDLRECPPLPGLATGKTELATVSCKHCQAVIAILSRGCTEIVVSSVDIGRAIPVAFDQGASYTSRYGCSRCGNICVACAKAMRATGGVCPGPWEARCEEARKQRKPVDQVTYNYRGTH